VYERRRQREDGDKEVTNKKKQTGQVTTGKYKCADIPVLFLQFQFDSVPFSHKNRGSGLDVVWSYLKLLACQTTDDFFHNVYQWFLTWGHGTPWGSQTLILGVPNANLEYQQISPNISNMKSIRY